MKPNKTLLVLAAAAFLLAATAAFAATPSQILATSLKAALAQGSVHYTALTSSAQTKVVFVGDAASDRGVQRVTFTRAGHTGHATVVVVKGNAYVKGDAFALSAFMGMPSILAAHNADRWIKIPPTSPLYKSVSAAVTLPSTLSELKPPKPYSSAQTLKTTSGRLLVLKSSYAISGHKVQTTLSLQAGAPHLPLEQDSSAQGVTQQTSFSRWHEAVKVTVPTKWTLVTKLK